MESAATDGTPHSLACRHWTHLTRFCGARAASSQRIVPYSGQGRLLQLCGAIILPIRPLSRAEAAFMIRGMKLPTVRRSERRVLSVAEETVGCWREMRCRFAQSRRS